MGNSDSHVTLGDRFKDAVGVNLHSARDGEKLDPKESQQRRLKICGEILSTEETYVALLSKMHRLFEAPMASFAKEAELRTIFSVSSAIRGLHEDFLVQLKERLEKPLHEKGYYTLQVGDLFGRYAGLMPMYSSYVDNYDASLEALAALAKKKGKKYAALEEAAKKETGNLGLSDLLILPVQRLPRYLMLLESLHKATLQDHKDYRMIEQAVASVSAVCQHINEAKRKAEQQQALVALAARCKRGGDLVLPSRRLLQQWAVGLPATGAAAAAAYALLAVFNDGVALFTGKSEAAQLKVQQLVLFSAIFSVQRGGAELRCSAAQQTLAVLTEDEAVDAAVVAAAVAAGFQVACVRAAARPQEPSLQHQSSSLSSSGGGLLSLLKRESPAKKSGPAAAEQDLVITRNDSPAK